MRRPILVAFLAFAPSLAWATDFVGADVCKSCHEKEYQDWRSSGHALALGRLSTVQQRDRVCRSCHTMEPLEAEVSLAGVQCESCHGAGALYSQRYVMKDKVLARLLGLEDVRADTCTRCHTNDGPSVTPFNLDEKLKLVSHGHEPRTRGKAKE
jgi:hypothetical protein